MKSTDEPPCPLCGREIVEGSWHSAEGCDSPGDLVSIICDCGETHLGVVAENACQLEWICPVEGLMRDGQRIMIRIMTKNETEPRLLGIRPCPTPGTSCPPAEVWSIGEMRLTICQTCHGHWGTSDADMRKVTMETEHNPTVEERNFRWAYQLLLALAKRRLADSNANLEFPDDWPGGQEWHEMVGSSHSIFLNAARDEAGIPHEEFLELIRNGTYDVEDLYDTACAQPELTTPEQSWKCPACLTVFPTVCNADLCCSLERAPRQWLRNSIEVK